jgi:hypothetical protein
MKERTLWEEAKDNWQVLHALRDDVRVQLHLGRMDALARWPKMESRIKAVEQVAHEVRATVREAVAELADELKEFRASVH